MLIDIFGSNISYENIVTTYKSFGDKSSTKMIIRKFIDDGGTNITAIDRSSKTSIESFGLFDAFENVFIDLI